MRSDCDISTARPLPRSPPMTSESRCDSAGATPSNGSSSSSRRVPTASARASATSFCWPPQSSSAVRSRISLQLRQDAVDEAEALVGSASVFDTHTGTRMFSSTVSCGTRPRSSGM